MIFYVFWCVFLCVFRVSCICFRVYSKCFVRFLVCSECMYFGMYSDFCGCLFKRFVCVGVYSGGLAGSSVFRGFFYECVAVYSVTFLCLRRCSDGFAFWSVFRNVSSGLLCIESALYVFVRVSMCIQSVCAFSCVFRVFRGAFCVLSEWFVCVFVCTSARSPCVLLCI